MAETEWVLVKRGLYWRPNGQGYTGLKRDAGRYAEAEAGDYADHGDGTTKMLLAEAPEIAPACYDDIALEYYKERAEAAETLLLSQASQIEALRKDRDANGARAEEQWAGWVKEQALRKAAETKLAEAISLLLKERQTRYASDVSPLENMKAIDTFLDANGGGNVG